MKIEMDDNTKIIISELLNHIFKVGAGFTLKIELRADFTTPDSNKFRVELNVK
jgi:hypothetical protein